MWQFCSSLCDKQSWRYNQFCSWLPKHGLLLLFPNYLISCNSIPLNAYHILSQEYPILIGTITYVNPFSQLANLLFFAVCPPKIQSQEKANLVFFVFFEPRTKVSQTCSLYPPLHRNHTHILLRKTPVLQWAIDVTNFF